MTQSTVTAAGPEAPLSGAIAPDGDTSNGSMSQPAGSGDQDPQFLARKLEFEKAERLRMGETNKQLNDRLRELEKAMKQQSDQSLAGQGQYEQLWKDAQKENAKLMAQIEALSREKDEIRAAVQQESLKAEALSLISNRNLGVAAPDQLLTLLQAKNGFRRDEETGQIQTVVNGVAVPLAEHLARLKQNPEWQHHFAPSGVSGMGAIGAAPSAMPSAGANPWKEESFNWTAQLLMEQQNPALAAQLKAEANLT